MFCKTFIEEPLPPSKWMVKKVTELSERSNVVLAKKDRELYPDAPWYRLYSNQWIALTEKCTIQEKVRLGSILDKECGGGLYMATGPLLAA